MVDPEASDPYKTFWKDMQAEPSQEFLKELHLTEGRGTGIPTMKKTLAQNGSPEPIFETDDQCTYFLSTLLIHPDWHPHNLSKQVSDQGNDPHSKQVKDESDIAGAQGAQAGAQALSKEQSTILSFCKKPRSRSEILAKIGLTNHRKNYLRHIVPLMDKSLVEMTIPETPTHMHQKYVLTEKGRTMLNQLNQNEL